MTRIPIKTIKNRKENTGYQLTCCKSRRDSTRVWITHTGTSQRIHFGTKRPVGNRAKTRKSNISFRNSSQLAGYCKTGKLPSATILLDDPCVTACKAMSNAIQESDLCQKINQPAENHISVERIVTRTLNQA